VSIKDSAETWVRGAPGQAMILVAAVGIVVGGVAGLGAGFKIEQNRTRSDVKKLRAELATKSSGTGATPTASASLGQRIGKVTKASGATITVSTKRQGSQKLITSGTTQFEQTAKGSTADIVVGRRVLVTVPGTAVIVLPTTSQLGRTVSSVGSSSFAIAKTNNAKAGSVSMSNIKEVDTVSTATLSSVKVGSDVLAGGRSAATKGSFNAAEVILLPVGSGFAS
jgi:hypothetical protein